MKNLFLFILFTLSINAQSLAVKSIEQITRLEQGEFFHPVVGPRGQLLFTGVGFLGLFLKNSDGEIKTLSEAPGAGYEPVFSSDGYYVYYRPYKYDGTTRLSSLVKKSISGGEERVLIKDERGFTSAKRLPDGTVAVNRKSNLYIADQSQKQSTNTPNFTSVFLEKGKMVLYNNGSKKTLMPLGDGFYLWPSISPDGSKLLFTKTGKGTFISNLDGQILIELGYGNSPQWSPDGRWVVFMRDLDDGHQIIESDIFIISADGKTTIAITETEDIKEVYPVWGSENEIVFGSVRGIIYKAILETME